MALLATTDTVSTKEPVYSLRSNNRGHLRKVESSSAKVHGKEMCQVNAMGGNGTTEYS